MRVLSALATAILLTAATVACGGDDSGQQEGRTLEQQQQRPAPGQQRGQPPAPQPRTDVSEEEMRAFTEAQMAIEEVQQEFGPQLQAAEDSAEADQIRREANEEMIRVVQESGLDEQRYMEIGRAIQTTPDLQDRFLEMRRELADEPER